MNKKSLAGYLSVITDVVLSCCAVDRTFSPPFCPNLRFCFCSCPQCWVSGRGVTTSSLSCSSSWTTTRSWRNLARIGSTCSTGTPSSRSLRCAWRSGRSREQAGIVTSTFKTHRFTFLLFSVFAVIGMTSVTALAGIHWILFCVGSTWFCLYLCSQTLFCSAPSPDQQRVPPWSWHPLPGHDGGLCDVGQHICGDES